MKVGIIGLPEVGKTTLFNALTRSNVATHRYQAHDDTVNLGSVAVPDPRFDYVVGACGPKKRTPAMMELSDGGARVRVHERGERFGADFFAGVRNVDALVLVVRGFHGDAVPEPDGGLDPARELQRLHDELLLADLLVVDGRLERLEKARLQKRQTPAEGAEQPVLLRIRDHLEASRPVRTLDLSGEEERATRGFAFVSGKPLIVVANTDEVPDHASLTALRDACRAGQFALIELCARVEMECAQMAPEEEREFLAALGIEEAARDRLIREAYRVLGYLSFFTIGPDEVRAWTLRHGATSLAAAEKVHSDMARGFIRAEVIAFDDFRQHGGWDQARAAGCMRLEGKDYRVRDGDVVHVRFSRG
ncbi:MAG TPA: DUF933 domain-containing protein [Chthonomonadales bacterium]|nr:DUF933 domain-containing protein [Chthonomonadales bacterium]